MSKGTTGGATKSGADFTAADIKRMLDEAKDQLRDEAKEHNERMDAYGQGVTELIKESTSSVNSTIEKTGKVIMDTIAVDGAETRKTIETASRVANDKLDVIVHRTKTTTGDVLGAIILGVVGFFGGWNIAGANTNLFINKLGIGVLGFIIGFMVVVAISAFVRGRYGKRVEGGAPAQPARPSAPAPEPEKPKPAVTEPKPEEKKPEGKKPEEESKPTAADEDRPAK